MGGDPKLKSSSSSSKKDAASGVDITNSSNLVSGATLAAVFAWATGRESTLHCFFAGGVWVLEGVVGAFRLALGPDMEFGICEALSLASSIWRPVAKGPGFKHLPAIFLVDAKTCSFAKQLHANSCLSFFQNTQPLR